MPGGDLPDWSTGRRVTGDPLITVNWPIPGAGYSSPILDVGEYSQIILSGSAQDNVAIFRVEVLFFADAAGAYTVMDEVVYLYGQFVIYTHAYTVSARYFQLKITELTATGNRMVFLIIPSSGPPIAIPPTPVVANGSEQLVNAGATYTLTPLDIFRDKVHISLATRSPRWAVTVWAATLNTIWNVTYTFSSLTYNSPVELDIPGYPARYKVDFKNNWTYNAYASIIIRQG